MEKIKVGIVGYGTIGKRVADAVILQDDMELIGVTGNSYNFRMDVANNLGIKIFTVAGGKDFNNNGIEPAGNFEDLLDKCDIVIDCTPKKIGRENKEKYYIPRKLKAIFQGGEKADIADTSFVAQCNYNNALNKDFVRVVSCNTTGLSRTLCAINKKFGINSVSATMIRRAADPMDASKGPINAIVPTMELPSHHGPDVQTVLKGVNIFTTAVAIPTTLMHLHTLTCDLKTKANAKEAIEVLKNTPRVRLIKASSGIESTAEIMELGKDLARSRGDMFEICVWEEAIGACENKLFYMQAIHQESDVVPENIDCIRAMMGFENAEESIKNTNESLKIKN